ncbi:MAG: hypothetical protein GY807_21065 [Gammaproteobacteria bacterium]|nr:hypothetical protein [Gammaproteobacteria bacterium]
MPIVPVQFGPDSGPARSTNASAGGLENCFAEVAPDSKTPFTIYSTPGLLEFADTGNSLGCRGGVVVNEETFYVVFGETLYKITSGGAVTTIGTLTGTDNVSMAYNKASPFEVAIAANGMAYILSSDVITAIADGDLDPNPIAVTYLDGYFVWYYATGNMQQSAINDGTSYGALEFANAEARQDKSRAGGVLADRLINFGASSVEFFYNAAPPEGFSFAPQPGATINRGILGRFCWAEFDNSVSWIDQNGKVVRSEGTIGRVISTPQIELDIQAAITAQQQTDIVVSTWTIAGHEMLQIWAPEWCWIYDASIQKWFRRKSQDRDTWAGKHVFHVFDKTIVGDAEDGILHEQSDNAYGESGKRLIRSMVSNYVDAGPGRVRHNALFIDIETGVGDAEDTDAEDVNPEIIVSWSDDGGHTYTGNRQISIGEQGDYNLRLRINRLGMSRDKGRVYKIDFSAARPYAFLGAYADVTGGTP